MSIAYVKKLKDIDNNTIYPQSITSAIVDKNGVALEDLHHTFVKSSSVENIENIENQYENINNKVAVVNENSTETQYPSAKAVYEAILESKAEGLSFVIVSELPTENINSGSIYLLSIESTEDSYDEYLYINEKWEKIGTTRVNLDNYYTKVEASNQFASKNIYTDTTINIGRKSGSTAGENSTTLGLQATASGKGSLATSYNTASGSYAVALGVDSVATAYGSIAAGQATAASFAGQVALGRYNINGDTESILIIGNGASGAKSNAHTVGLDGTGWFSGDVYVNSTSGTNKDAGSKKLATEEFVNNKIMSSTVDIGENATLENGVIYLVYEE